MIRRPYLSEQRDSSQCIFLFRERTAASVIFWSGLKRFLKVLFCILKFLDIVLAVQP